LLTGGWRSIEAESSGTAQFFAFRINRLKIFKNREWGAGELKMISFVSTGDEAPSALDGLLQTSDPNARRKILRDASRQMLSVKEFIQVDEIRDGHVLTLGDSGYALYTAMRIPLSLNWTFLILESDEDLVELGRRIDTVVDVKDFDTFATSAITLVEDIQMPPLHRLDVVVAGHRSSCPSTFLRPQLGRFLNLQEKCGGLRLKPRLHHVPTLPKPQQLSKGLLRCHRSPSSATRQAPLPTGNSEEPVKPDKPRIYTPVY
jgi:hypothetical protein